MTKSRNLVTRSLLLVAFATIAVVLSPSIARADAISFTVNEGAVTGATPNTLSPDPNDITGKYQEYVTLDDNGVGTFSATLVVTFTGYVDANTPSHAGTGPVPSQIGGFVDPVDGDSDGIDDDTGLPILPGTENQYGLYALVTVSGSYSTSVNSDGNLVYSFEPTASDAAIYTDPNRNTVTNYQAATATSGAGEDQLVMTASGINPLPSFGTVIICTSAGCGNTNNVLTGSYVLEYTNVDVALDSYWPTLALLTLRATASGDVDTPAQGSVFPTNVRGDTDITFEEVPTTTVPEPASLLLLGGGLLGLAARRRRAAKK